MTIIELYSSNWNFRSSEWFFPSSWLTHFLVASPPPSARHRVPGRRRLQSTPATGWEMENGGTADIERGEKGEIPPWRIGDSTGAVSMLMRQTPWISGWIPQKINSEHQGIAWVKWPRAKVFWFSRHPNPPSHYHLVMKHGNWNGLNRLQISVNLRHISLNSFRLGPLWMINPDQRHVFPVPLWL